MACRRCGSRPGRVLKGELEKQRVPISCEQRAHRRSAVDHGEPDVELVAVDHDVGNEIPGAVFEQVIKPSFTNKSRMSFGLSFSRSGSDVFLGRKRIEQFKTGFCVRSDRPNVMNACRLVCVAQNNQFFALPGSRKSE